VQRPSKKVPAFLGRRPEFWHGVRLVSTGDLRNLKDHTAEVTFRQFAPAATQKGHNHRQAAELQKKAETAFSPLHTDSPHDKLSRWDQGNRYNDYTLDCTQPQSIPKAPIMDPASLTAALKEETLRLGFDLVGATPAVAPPDFDYVRQWVASGYAGEMRFFVDRLDAYRHPNSILEGVKSILMMGMNYRSVEPVDAGPGQAMVARYAWGADYHDTIRVRLHQLADFHRRHVPTSAVRGVVDTAPLFERHLGQLAGLGWIGKNTALINPGLGSWFFLAALLTTEELAYDEPADMDCCGTCRACIEACPTGALMEPGVIDARKCISYLTVEMRGDVCEEDRKSCGKRLFGCDACQEACPWNRCTPLTDEAAFHPSEGMNPVEVRDLLGLDEAGFRRRFRHTPLWRARRVKIQGILRTINGRD
jgi:epoxyqueuosine reductase